MDNTLLSYRRVRGLEFAERFYRRFLARSPEIQEVFARTDFNRQREMLLHGVSMLLEHAHGRAVGTLALQRLRTVHEKMLLPAWMYDVWCECLLATVQEMDPEWTEELASQWRHDLQSGVELVRGPLREAKAPAVPPKAPSVPPGNTGRTR
ncbi:MAG: globin domain-containing protein [Myxococcota bacterium]